MPVPGRIQKIKAGDQEHNAVEQQFEISREGWNEYKLLDGGTVRLKTTVQKIYRIVDADGNQLYNQEGEMHLLVRHKADVVSSE
jgi:hypothetical protein